ncbi:DNA mismatch repair protein MutS [Perlabentimonas gracilis]|uniref:DNA mismatch repair protein MutS n=1 Tax=Perlabentimonas gracilis TaxID=2715279 RepID=UPI00140D0174|nr:DNA mismatch repair protein MutS [Perlabentimonas gracilis]NHB69109.1 DNA mismatch repair protein MutS [Perlabentimonas gracilis]
MKQYNSIKRKHPDAILLFRVGDFYETFSEDAIKAAEILGITLTRRANGAASFVELAGFPHHALDTYLPKLVRAGQRVAICEQLEDPKMTKTIVKRGVTEMVTPGVSFNDNVLERKENNFLACVHLDKRAAGVAFLDISTGEFYLAEGSYEYIDKLITNFNPKEVLVERSKYRDFVDFFGTRYYVYKFDEWAYHEEGAREKLVNHFQTASLKGFGVDGMSLGIVAAGAALYYLDITQHSQAKHLATISRIEEEKYVWLDKFTIRNLELFYSVNEGAKTLVDIIDKTVSPMGSRLLKKWISLPLKDEKPIAERLNVVEYFINSIDKADLLRDGIREMGDLERVISKAAVGRISPREIVTLKNALEALVTIKQTCEQSDEPTLMRLGEQINLCTRIRERIEREIVEDPPAQLNKGNVIASGVNADLDELREIMHSGKEYLLNLQQRESERTGISSLKVSFNNVFGYYIEVRNTHKDKVPPEWIRKQTLVSAERYITEELKEYEAKILGAEEKVMAIEQQIFEQLVFSLTEYIASIQLNANLVAQLDCLLSFASSAAEYGYCKPKVNQGDAIDIREGRHPVIERMLPAGEEYVSNDVLLNGDAQQIIIITGPNMSGKSALLRQTALIVLMAQMGSYVPANAATIGLVDKIFTRVGASDNISLGESTFMVEMHEAASILNNISDRSLVLLDEIGRGTSTYDGISIAWAMTEYIHENPNGKAKTLFATHYHELNEMEGAFPRIKNYNVSIKELDNKVIFLRKLVPGGSAHSFGIHVARMAGMPPSVVKRATEILADLEKSPQDQRLNKPSAELGKSREGYQLSIFQLDDPVLKQIRDQLLSLDINNLTPVEALNKLNDIKRLAGVSDKK